MELLYPAYVHGAKIIHTEENTMSRNWKRLGILLIVMAVAAGGVFYVTGRNRAAAPSTTQTTSTTTTAQVVRGNLTITADGTGNLIAGDEADEAFATGGELTELDVAAGDKVEAGDVLAKVDDADAQATLISAELQLLKAQLDLASANTNLAAVQAGPSDADLIAAKAALAEAKDAYTDLVNGPDATTIEKLQMSLDQAKNSLYSSQLARAAAGGETYGQLEQARMALANAEISVRRAELDLADAKATATDTELLAAKAQIAQAQQALDDLRATSSDTNVATADAQVKEAELTLKQAELNLAAAQAAVDDTTLVASISGTVMSVSAKVGDKIGSSSMITIADLDHPKLQFYVEEDDLSNIAVGKTVNIVFSALPDLTFTGQVVSIDPALVSVSNTTAVEAEASIELTDKTLTLLSGMNADVEVIAGQAKDALLIPVGALHETPDGKYTVTVVNSDGQTELRTVQVGLQDAVYAEITSGLEVGETVTTSGTTTSTTSGSSNSSNQQQMVPPDGGMMPPLGG
jgi:RND family efflux transporter MFP subunit